jgi:hypothetical protein
MLLLDAGPLDFIDQIIQLVKLVGIGFMFLLAALGIRLLGRQLRSPPSRAPLRVIGGVLLVLPASVWLISVAQDYFRQSIQKRSQQAADAARIQQVAGTYRYVPDEAAADTAYAFNLTLRPDRTYEWTTTLPNLDAASRGVWRANEEVAGKPQLALVSTSNVNSHVLVLYACAAGPGQCWEGQTRGTGYGTPAEIRAQPIRLLKTTQAARQ